MSLIMIEPKCTMDELVLPDHVVDLVAEILEDHAYQDALLEAGLHPRKKILLHGPSGCGKTSIAHAFAKALGIKLYFASAASLVDSHMGSSEKNVDQAFKFGQMNRVVVLLDEFDSIAAKRTVGDGAATKTDNRIVNTILTSMEEKAPLGVFLACTNFMDHLDEAILRRFDVVVEVPAPGRIALKKIANNILAGRFEITAEEILEEASTPSDVVRVALAKLRRAVIQSEKDKRNVGKQEAFAQLSELKTKLNKPKGRTANAQ